jgi:hypothetical protein
MPYAHAGTELQIPEWSQERVCHRGFYTRPKFRTISLLEAYGA